MVLFYTNSHFQKISVPFERISLINFFSLVLRGEGGGEERQTFFACELLPQGPGFCNLSLPGEWGFRPSKNSQEVSPGIS